MKEGVLFIGALMRKCAVQQHDEKRMNEEVSVDFTGESR